MNANDAKQLSELQTRQDATDTNIKRLGREIEHEEARLPIGDMPPEVLAREESNKRIGERVRARDAEIAEFHRLQGEMSAIHKQYADQALLDRTPSLDEKTNLLRVKAMEQGIKDMRKAHAAADAIAQAEAALALFIRKCRLHELYVIYNTAARQLAPTLTEIMQIISTAPSREARQELDEVGTAVCHPCVAVRYLPVVFFPPDRYEPLQDPRGIDGSYLYHWYPVNA